MQNWVKISLSFKKMKAVATMGPRQMYRCLFYRETGPRWLNIHVVVIVDFPRRCSYVETRNKPWSCILCGLEMAWAQGSFRTFFLCSLRPDGWEKASVCRTAIINRMVVVVLDSELFGSDTPLSKHVMAMIIYHRCKQTASKMKGTRHRSIRSTIETVVCSFILLVVTLRSTPSKQWMVDLFCNNNSVRRLCHPIDGYLPWISH